MKLLVKVATELNVGLHTVVEHLQKKGFEIDQKPTAKVTDEMYAELLKEFQGSIKEKEAADLLQKTMPAAPVVTKEKPKINLFGDPTPAPPPPAPKEKVETKKEVVPEVKPEEVISAKVDEENKPKIKVVGKIDLEKPESKTKKKTKKEEVAEAPPVKVEPAAPEVPAEEEITRIEAPQLKGLKILGKIDTNKFKEPSKKKEEAKKPAASSTPGASQPKTTAESEADKKETQTQTQKS